MRMGDVPVQVMVPPQRTQPPLVKHAAVVWEVASSGSDACRANLPTRMLIRSDDVASMTRLRIPPGRQANGKAVMLSSMIRCAL